MAGPTHPNDFNIRQEVLFRLHDDPSWRAGVIQGITADDRDDRNSHGEGCDELLYSIADHAFDTMVSEDRKRRLIIECQCDAMIADADATGRWHGQRLGGSIGLALLLTDVERRKTHVELDPAISDDHTDPAKPDRVMIVEVPGYHHLASVRIDELVAWASGVPASRWKEPTE